MKYKRTIFSGVVLVGILGVGFFIGMKYQEKRFKVQLKNSPAITDSSGARVMSNSRGSLFTGHVISANKKSVTIKLTDGTSKVILFSPLVRIKKTVVGDEDDLIPGKEITSIGLNNTDGQFVATSIDVKQ